MMTLDSKMKKKNEREKWKKKFACACIIESHTQHMTSLHVIIQFLSNIEHIRNERADQWWKFYATLLSLSVTLISSSNVFSRPFNFRAWHWIQRNLKPIYFNDFFLYIFIFFENPIKLEYSIRFLKLSKNKIGKNNIAV